MIRKKIILVFISVLLIQGIFSQTENANSDVLNLGALGDDLNIIAESVGEQLTPNLEQIALTGDIVGEAEMGDFPSLSLNIISVGATVYNGLAKSLYDDETEWNFVVPVSNLIVTMLSNMDSTVQNAYYLGEKAMATPVVNLGFGTGLTNGFEFFAEGMYIPGELASTSTFGIASPSAFLDQKFIRAKLRKVLVHDIGVSPAISLGIGYNYLSTGLHAGIDSFGDENISVLGLYMNGDAEFDLLTEVHGFGMDLHLSKRLLLFTPYIKLSPYYSLANYTLDLNMNAKLYTGETPSSTLITTQKLEGHGLNTIKDLNLYATVGNEIKLGFLILNTNILLNTQKFAFNLGKILDGLDSSETRLNGFSVNIGLRMQFPLTGKMRDKIEK